jgi:hypothetical protein
MEHRYSSRAPANLKVLIYKRGLPIAIGWLRNVSRHGLFIASEYDNVQTNQPVEIEFLGDRTDGDSHRRCRGMIAHKTMAGFGLAVDDDCPVSCELVAELVMKFRRLHAAFSAPSRIADVSADPIMYV